MPGAKKNFIGLEGFIWWIGVVEDRNDPEQLGRVRVRCFGWHTEDKVKIPTDTLPWAHPIVPVNSPNAYTPKEGDMVFGFFIDGDNAQNPAIVGVLPGKPDNKPNYEKGFSDPGTSLGSRPKKPDDSAEKYPKNKYIKESTVNRLARGKSDGTVIATRKKNQKKNIQSAGGVSWSEPAPAFAPKYPYNNALETESGHALEFDDTPGKERIHWAHRNGSYIEVDTNGNRIERIQKDHYTVVMGSDYVYIDGKCSVTVGGDCNLKVGGNMNIEVAGNYNLSVTGDVRIKSKKNFTESTSDMNINALGVANLTANKKLSLKGETAALQGDVVDIPAAQINMQSGSATSASGSGLTGGGSVASAEDAAIAANTNAELAASNSVPNLQEVGIAAQKIPTEGVSVGKALEGVTSTVSNVFNKLNDAANSLGQDLGSNILPLGELTQKVANFETSLNENKGQILGLKDNLKNTLYEKIDDVAVKAAAKNIDFNLDSQLQNDINKTVNPVAATVTTVGKRIFPKTETLEEVSIATQKTSSNSSGGSG